MPNQRKSSRHPVLASRSRCELRLGSLLVPAMLVDESTDGCGVLVGGLPRISANQRAQFRNDRGWYDCRIIHAMEVASTQAISESVVPCAEIQYLAEDDASTKYITAADIKDFMAGTEGPWFRLGLRVLGRIAPPSEPAASLPVVSSGVNPMQWIKSALASVFSH